MNRTLAALVPGILTACMPLQALSEAPAAATLIVPPVIDRSGTAEAVLHLEHALTGTGTLHVRWSDSLGRVVADTTTPLTLTDEVDFSFPLELDRAVTMKNTVEATLQLDSVGPKGKQPVTETATADFIARPRGGPWNDFQIIMYQQYSEPIQRKLAELGINGGQWVGRTVDPPHFLINTNRRWYSEQIAPDFYAEYHRFRTDRGVDWSFQQARELYFKDPSSMAALKRHPSFEDPTWLVRLHDRLVDVVRRNQPYQPFFYSLSDESGIADLGAQWDFDFSDESLVPMRRWLRTQYGTLQALNAEWGTHFGSWDLVVPMTTNTAMRQADDNFASWGDFKTWMDISYANALQFGVNAAHEVNPAAYVGIVGAQKPGWGGYDYSRLTRVVNVMEPYDIGYSVKLAHTLNPQIPLLTTTFASGQWEKHRIWYEVLQGNRGLILWDESQRYIRPDGSRGAAGTAAAGYYNELRDGMGALLINSQSQTDGIAIHYSQPSMRTEWMLERRPDGDAWMKRNAAYERAHNDFLRLRESWAHAIEDQGLQYSFLSYLQVEDGNLLGHGYRVLLLPHSSSLSHKETDAMRAFVQSGGTLIADSMPGLFDEHSRRLSASPLADLFAEPASPSAPLTIKATGKGKAILVRRDLVNYLQDRMQSHEQPLASVVADVFRTAGIHPSISVTDEHGQPIVGVIVRSFSNGGAQLLTLQSNPQQQVDELGPADFHTNQRFAVKHTVHITLPSAMYVYDTRQQQRLGRQTRFTAEIDPYEPTVLALSPTDLPLLQIDLPALAPRGAQVPLLLSTPGTPSQTAIFHVEVIDPSGQRNLQYSTNVIATGDSARLNLPMAQNDATGIWTVRVRDMLSGSTETRKLEVR